MEQPSLSARVNWNATIPDFWGQPKLAFPKTGKGSVKDLRTTSKPTAPLIIWVRVIGDETQLQITDVSSRELTVPVRKYSNNNTIDKVFRVVNTSLLAKILYVRLVYTDTFELDVKVSTSRTTSTPCIYEKVVDVWQLK
jgi:hypothetical protein